MKKYLIIVEGIADAVFLKDYLLYLFADIKFRFLASNPRKKIQSSFLKTQAFEIEIFEAGGFEGIKPNFEKLEEKIDDSYLTLVIFDTDNPAIQQGGFDLRMKYLNHIKHDLQTRYNIFLLPNHREHGNLETLLLSIVKREKYAPFAACLQNYINCMKSFSPIHEQVEIDLSDDKSKVFSFVLSYKGKDFANVAARHYTADLWDFSHVALNPLREFLIKNIKF